MMTVRLLGPVDVLVDGTPRRLSGLRRKAVLAVLALHAGEVVSTDRIVDLVWGDHPPATVANVLQNVVSYLRGLLGDRSLIVAGAPGYALRLPAAAVDVFQAEELILNRRAGTDPAGRTARLRTAVELWRGASLADVTAVPWLAEQGRRLDGLRAGASAALIDARMALGEHAELMPELEQLTAAYPFQEDLHRQLILALYRSGRPDDALAAYQRLHGAMADELGIEPSPDLSELAGAVRRRDPRLDPVAAPRVPVPAGAVTPAQLPRAIPAFTGRAAQLAGLDAVLTDAGARDTVVVVVSGTAGVGKTTLAVRWANGVAAAFPDGQLYVNLRGFDPAGQAVPPTEVLHGFLQALGVPAKEIPAALDERAALYRTVLAGRRTLIVLDNAGDEDHVRPLLPGAPGALVLVTSRDRLTGLVVAEGARPIPLDLPSVAEARQILAQRLGAERVAAEPDAVDAIIARCARLPLALAVAAAHPAADPAFTLGGLADQLGRGGSALDSFPGGDPATDVRLVFARSYRALSEPAARLFRLLGVCPTAPHLTLAGAASLAGRSTTETRRLLAELTRMHLLTGLARDRYGCHDLLRAFATELTSGLDRAADRSAALHRLLEHYLHTAFAAGLQLRPGNPPVILPAAPSGVSAGRPADIGAATTWFTDELSALLAAVRLTPPAPDWRPWQLACGLIPFLDQQGRWDDYAASFHAGFAAAERAGDTLGQAHAQFYLGRVHVKMNRLAEAREHLERAIHLFGVIGDASGQAGAYLDAAHVAELEGRDRDSMRQCERALVLNRAAGDRAGEAYTLSNLGYLHLKLGDLDRALELNEQGLAMHRDNGDHRGQADTLNHLGRVHFRRGDSRRGADSYGGAIAIYQRFGFRRYEADSLTLLGDDLAAAGDLDAARGAWQRAKTLLDDLGRPDAGPTVLAAR